MRYKIPPCGDASPSTWFPGAGQRHDANLCHAPCPFFLSAASSPLDLTAVNQLKGASSGQSDADLAKERSAPLSGVVLQYQRQLEKERREKGKANKGATEGIGPLLPAACCCAEEPS